MRVLLGIGGGADGFRALASITERAAAGQFDLTVAIIDSPETDIELSTLEEEVRDRLADAGIEPDVRRLAGDPGGQLVTLADTEGFDAIAIGGGEYSPLGKVTLGPVAEFVVLNATVTVMLVR